MLLSLLSIENLPGSEKGGDDLQMMPELLNKGFSVKAAQQKPENTIKITTLFLTYNFTLSTALTTDQQSPKWQSVMHACSSSCHVNTDRKQLHTTTPVGRT